MTTKTLTPARIQIVTSALYRYSLSCCQQYSKRVQRQAMKIATSGKLFAFRVHGRHGGGMPRLGTIKNALRFSRAELALVAA